MREIDDRYPEFAAPYEPVKRGKHHKRLGRRQPIVMICMAAVVALWLILPSLAPAPAPRPTPTPVVDPIPEPEPIPEP